jgi:hypothetical protein
MSLNMMAASSRVEAAPVSDIGKRDPPIRIYRREISNATPIGGHRLIKQAQSEGEIR